MYDGIQRFLFDEGILIYKSKVIIKISLLTTELLQGVNGFVFKQQYKILY